MFTFKQSDQALSVPEKQAEEHLLPQFFKERNGQIYKVFTRSKRRENVFYYNCLLCKVFNLKGEELLQVHVLGKKHETNLFLKQLFFTKAAKQDYNGPKSSINQDSIESLPSSSTTSRDTDRRSSVQLEIINKNYEEYQKDPEKHPLYKDEYTKFCEFRSRHPKYKPDWNIYWTQKLIILKEAEINKELIILRKKLNLLLKPADVKESSVVKQLTCESSYPNRPAEHSVHPIPISRYSRDIKKLKNLRYRQNGYQKHQERCHFEEAQKRSRRRTFKESDRAFFEYRAQDSYRPQETVIKDESDDSEVTVVSVCRLLTALESELGILGSIVLDLLSQALSLEKLKPNSSDEILLTTENCVVFETIKEKFKGLLILDVLAVNKVLAVKKSVQYIAKLMHQAKLLESEKSKRESLALEVTKAAQHKIGINTEEMEALIDMYVEAKKNRIEGGSALQMEEFKMEPFPEPSKETVTASTTDSSSDVNMGEDDVDCNSDNGEVSPPPSVISSIENNPIFKLDDVNNVKQSLERPASKLSFTDTDDSTDNLLGSLKSE